METEKVNTELESLIDQLVGEWVIQAKPEYPLILAAHASVQNAVYGNERSVMLGSDLVLPGGLVRNPRLDYVALGHIHHAQDVNQGRHPPVIYPGSIERVDFGEAQDKKFFVTAEVEKGRTTFEFRELQGRRFFDRFLRFEMEESMPSAGAFRARLTAALPSPQEMQDAVVRLVLEYPRSWEGLIDEGELRDYASGALEFHFIRRPQVEARIRLSGNDTITNLPHNELMVEYLKMMKTPEDDVSRLKPLIEEVIRRSRTEEEN
jgi:exonuclease SbcD